MAGDGWSAVALDELPLLDGDDLPAWRPVRHGLELAAFGVNAWIGRAAGDELIDDHDEAEDGGGQEELYFVVSGRADLRSTATAFRRPPGRSLRCATRRCGAPPSPARTGRSSWPWVAIATARSRRATGSCGAWRRWPTADGLALGGQAALAPDGPRLMTSRALPMACTLTAGDLATRLAEIGALGRDGLLRAEVDGPRAVLVFRAGVRERVEAVAATEAECCAVLAIDVRGGGDGGEVELHIAGPPEAEPVVRELVASFG